MSMTDRQRRTSHKLADDIRVEKRRAIKEKYTTSAVDNVAIHKATTDLDKAYREAVASLTLRSGTAGEAFDVVMNFEKHKI